MTTPSISRYSFHSILPLSYATQRPLPRLHASPPHTTSSTPSPYTDTLDVSSAAAASVNPRYVDATGAARPPPKKAELIPIDGVESLPLTQHVTLLRGRTSQRLKPNVEYALQAGTSDNTYLIQRGRAGITEAGFVLIDVPDANFLTPWLDTLSQITPASAISDLILTHLSPARVDGLRALLQARSRGKATARLRVYVSNPAASALQFALEDDPETRAALDVITVRGTGVTVNLRRAPADNLQLVLAPSPRWPDLMCAYLPDTQRGAGVLFSSKLFAAHLVLPEGEAYDGAWPQAKLDPHWRHFFETTVAATPLAAEAALSRLYVIPTVAPLPPPSAVDQASAFLRRWTGLAPSVAPQASTERPRPTALLAPIHGPVVKSSVSHLVEEYLTWAREIKARLAEGKVAVLFASAYGNTAAIALALAHGVTRGGLAADAVNLEVATPVEVAEAVRSAQAVAIGSPTLGGHMPTQVREALGILLTETGKGGALPPAGVFGSFGWSGEAVDELAAKLGDAGFPQAFPPIRVKFTPSPETLLGCEQAGVALAEAARKVQRRKRAAAGAAMGAEAVTGREGQASAPQRAMGRVVGPLCVLTVAQGGESSDAPAGVMLASWVSQAAFSPPAVTVSIKKDRAIEPLLCEGATFNLSVLAEGPSQRSVMRRLSRPSVPGEDRLAGLPTEDGPGGAPVLSTAASFVHCRVGGRMEAGDHWIVLAQVLDGKVLDDQADPHVHHRKVGNHY